MVNNYINGEKSSVDRKESDKENSSILKNMHIENTNMNDSVE